MLENWDFDWKSLNLKDLYTYKYLSDSKFRNNKTFFWKTWKFSWSIPKVTVSME
jgi:hypothetical protein